MPRWSTSPARRSAAGRPLARGATSSAATSAPAAASLPRTPRDFKPDNVLVGDDGRVRVTDFGLVSVAGIDVGALDTIAGDALVTSLTRTGAIMGTPRYMAPEQHEAGSMYRRYLTVAVHATPPERAQAQQRLDELGTCATLTARDAYTAGEAAYNRGDFKAAVEYFKRGFALAPDMDKTALPYLFNMGQAYRQMGDCADASLAFKKYLTLKTDAPEKVRTMLGTIIPQLDECAAQQAAAAAPPAR